MQKRRRKKSHKLEWNEETQYFVNFGCNKIFTLITCARLSQFFLQHRQKKTVFTVHGFVPFNLYSRASYGIPSFDRDSGQKMNSLA